MMSRVDRMLVRETVNVSLPCFDCAECLRDLKSHPLLQPDPDWSLPSLAAGCPDHGS